jgi:3-hydroxybutyryl-CoA dehydrogenase
MSAVAVLGAGTMGAGIATVFAAAGHDVALFSRSAERGDQARELVERTGGAEAAARVRTTTDAGDAVAGASLVCETVVEDLEAKHEVFRIAEDAAPAGALLSTNTSSLPIDRIADGLRDPGRLVGLHWFNPATVMPLIEIVRGARTSDASVEAARDWCRRVGKETIEVASDIPGFVVNRLQYAMLREATHLVQAGVASIEDVDRAVATTLAPRWSACGPLELMDLAGLDTVRRVAGVLMRELDNSPEVPPLVATTFASGATGAREGRGFYAWSPERVAQKQELRDRMVREAVRIRRESEGAEAGESEAAGEGA